MIYRRCICHPDDLPGVGISSGWVTANSLCHPDDIIFHFMSSGWLNWGWFLIRMSYGNVIMSSGWDTLPFLSHPDEIANFDFPQHAVALQRFRTFAWSQHSGETLVPRAQCIIQQRCDNVNSVGLIAVFVLVLGVKYLCRQEIPLSKDILGDFTTKWWLGVSTKLCENR